MQNISGVVTVHLQCQLPGGGLRVSSKSFELATDRNIRVSQATGHRDRAHRPAGRTPQIGTTKKSYCNLHCIVFTPQFLKSVLKL